MLVAPDPSGRGATDPGLSAAGSGARIAKLGLWLLELAYGPRVDPYQWSAADDRRFLCVLAEVASETTSGFGEAGFIDTEPLVRAPELLEIWADAAAPRLLGRPIEEFRALGVLLQAEPLPAVENKQADGLASWRTYHAGALVFGPARRGRRVSPLGSLCAGDRRADAGPLRAWRPAAHPGRPGGRTLRPA